jgi:hypothetical protein
MNNLHLHPRVCDTPVFWLKLYYNDHRPCHFHAGDQAARPRVIRDAGDEPRSAGLSQPAKGGC